MIRLRKIKYGDVIFADRGFYKHFGIYSGNQKVIHYYHAAEKICETSFAAFMDGDTDCYVCNFDERGARTSEELSFLSTPRGFSSNPIGGLFLLRELYKFLRDFDSKLYSPEETVQRARSKLGESEYNLFLNNCEHFAIWCKTGVSKSEQIDAIIDAVIGAATSARVR